MRPVLSSGPRLRAAGLLLAVLALAGTTTASHSSGGAALAGAPDQAAADVLHAARAQLGDGYEWGGNGPWTWDCSGLTRLWTGARGVTGMPRVSRDQHRWAVPIPREQLLIGDLVFYNDPVDHVGIYAGGGRMVDASSARKGVVERPLWSAGVVRYGRVPRPGMPAVTPWTPPPVVARSPVAPSPATTSKPAPRPVAAPPAAQPVPPAPRPVAAPPVAPSSGLRPLAGLPATQKGLSSLVGYRSAPVARSLVGQPAGPDGWSDVALVHVSWRNAGGGSLPGDRDRLVAKGRPVPLADARIGDLVVYGRPALPHLGVYVGGGLMVDASPKQGRVVLRPVYAASTVTLVRLG
ncbi:hypothetical protein BH24ACT10_BH24ACT10_06610 [soil metagenome]